MKRTEEEEEKAARLAALLDLSRGTASFPNELVEQDGVSEEQGANAPARGRPRFPNR